MRREPLGHDAEAIVDAIITAAEHALENEGLPGFSTNRVAELAGVSIGSLYRYFPNKYALARGVFDRHLAAYERVIIESGAGAGNIRDYVIRVGAGIMTFFDRRPRIHRALWRLRTAAEVHERIDAAWTAMIAVTTRVMESAGVPAQRAGDLAFVLVHAADGVANAVALRSDPELGRRTVAILAEIASTLVATGVVVAPGLDAGGAADQSAVLAGRTANHSGNSSTK
jgi:AcrR family transcriptional regulator